MSKTNDVTTKKFVRDTVKKTEKVLQSEMGRLERKIGNVEEKLRSEMKNNHNEVIEKLDSIVGIIKKTDEEQTLLAYRVAKHSDDLESHEERLKKLEKSTIQSAG